MNFDDQQKVEKTFKFFDMAAIERMHSYSNDLDRLVDADNVELLEDEEGVRLVFDFSRSAMDSNGFHVGTESCRVTFLTFDASQMMYVNPQQKEDYPMHGIGITLDLHDAVFELEPAREEISWEEIFLENHPEYADHLQTFKENEADDDSSFDEEDFCGWMKNNHDIDVDREAYFDSYYPPDDDFWFQELEGKFDKLKDDLRRTYWKFNPDHAKNEEEPWQLETRSE